MSVLIDTTEMYLKTIYALQEEGVPALRARIVERLEQSGPTVSETVARLERDGLLLVGENREIAFTPAGLEKATGVMRRHRLAERMLTDVLKMDISLVHDEACRWEHAISEAAADLMESHLGHPQTDPFGNPIPDPKDSPQDLRATNDSGVITLQQVVDDAAQAGSAVQVKLERLGEHVQTDQVALSSLMGCGVLPGTELVVAPSAMGIEIRTADGEALEVPHYLRHAVFVRIVES